MRNRAQLCNMLMLHSPTFLHMMPGSLGEMNPSWLTQLPEWLPALDHSPLLNDRFRLSMKICAMIWKKWPSHWLYLLPPLKSDLRIALLLQAQGVRYGLESVQELSLSLENLYDRSVSRIIQAVPP